MKQVKFAKRIVLGLLGTAALTSFIFAYSADHAASHSAVQKNSDIADHTTLSNETGLRTKDEMLSIGTSERHMLYQPQDTMPSQAGEPSDAAQSKAAASDTMSSEQSDTASSDHQQRTQTANPSDDQKNKTEKKAGSQADHQDGQTEDKDRNAFRTVTQDYFSDALFIGDSRTVGMLQSHLLPEASYYAKTGIGIGEILSKPIVNEGGRMISVKDALCLHSFGKVYIMIGINDIAAGDTDWFTEQYKNILETVRQTQPDAVVYIQGNIPMSYGTQDLSGALNNKNLSIRNEASRTLADMENIFYLDIDKIYADADGNLQSSYTTDGLHVSTCYYPLWVDYLLQHAIVH